MTDGSQPALNDSAVFAVAEFDAASSKARQALRAGAAQAHATALAFPRAAGLGLRLRAEVDADRPFTAELYASTRREELADVPWDEAQKSAFLSQQHDAQHDHYRCHYDGASWLIVECAGEPVGRLYFVRWPREVRIIDIAIVPAARGRGFGSALLGDVIEAAEKKSVSIHVERLNPALSLYRRLGFELVEDKGVYLLLERRPPPEPVPAHRRNR